MKNWKKNKRKKATTTRKTLTHKTKRTETQTYKESYLVLHSFTTATDFVFFAFNEIDNKAIATFVYIMF